MNTRNILIGSLFVVAGLILFSASVVMAQPIDYCEGNFDNDYDVDGSDAFVFKTDFGRSSLSDPCPVIECQTAEELEIRIVQLETQVAQMTALLENVTRDTVQGHDTIRFSGVNVQIVDGSETTAGDVNGLGNLIIGYNELRGDGTDDRSGSHNLVVGPRHNYSSYGGLVAGYQNNVLGVYATVSGGQNNTASGDQASVSGGARNTASGWHASVTGGRYNEASGDFSFVGGGGYTTEADGNKAFGHYSAVLGGRSNLTGDPDLIDHTFAQSATVSGGQHNIASGSRSTVSGGFSNISTHWGATVSGGEYNTASGLNASVAGGRYNEASGDYSFVGGGGYEVLAFGNKAFGHYSAVLGGTLNVAGDPDLSDHTMGEISTVSGGYGNKASGLNASVSGGIYNTATAWSANVCGGGSNAAIANFATVSGGQNNTASGESASVSGGRYNEASGDYSFVGGGGYEDVSYGNQAFGHYSAVVGGRFNIAGDRDLTDPTMGEASIVSGGYGNRASGHYANVSGGQVNGASGILSSISGGTGLSAYDYDWRGGSCYFCDN